MGNPLEFRNMEIWVHPIPVPIPPVFIFFTFFLLLYFVAYFLVFKTWSPKLRPEASSCFMSLFHGTPAAILATFSLLSNPHRHPDSFASANTPFQNIVLEYSIAYFTMDLIHYLIFYPNEILFMAHHLATLFVFLTCRYAVSHGAFSILVLLVLAEVTSFLQNLWTLANVRRFDNEFAAKMYAVLSLPFYGLYSIVRGFLGPMFVYRMAAFYISGGADGLIPRWVWASWIVVVAAAIMVSILWIWNLWVDFIRERSRGGLEKKVE